MMLLFLPCAVYYLWFCLDRNRGAPIWPSISLLQDIPRPTWTSAVIVVGWLTFQALLQIYGPGRWVEGAALADGVRLRYRMNGWFAWWFTWATVVIGVAVGLISPTFLADQFGPLLTVTNIAAFLFSFCLYWHGKAFGRREERIRGQVVSDFWFGTTLNPRVGRFDLKLFCEARPGLIAWVLIDLSFAAKQRELHGSVTTPMILVCLFQFWYVADYFLHEEAILSTWDIRHENFGWMLCWGDLVWLPFTYSIQANYLVNNLHDLPWWGVVCIVLLNLCGYVIFRGANIQKHQFRKNPALTVWGRQPVYIDTSQGSFLLASGWWGLARHMNYLGDVLMGLAWCLTCLFGSPLPYSYFAYFVVLLVHRERRDNSLCAARYGTAWDAYCRKVPYRIIPGLY